MAGPTAIRQNVGVSVKRNSLSLGAAVGLYGNAFGAAAVASGFSVPQACFISLILFSGASQFAAVGVIGAGGNPLSAIATAALLGTRNALYAFRMVPILQVHGLKKIFAAQLTIDESTGMAVAQEDDQDSKTGFWWTGVAVFIFWNLFTFTGALSAEALGDPAKWGLDAIVPAAFLGLLWAQIKNKRHTQLAVVSALFALALVHFVPAGVPIMATALLAIARGWRQ